jgi:hypothetical protein
MSKTDYWLCDVCDRKTFYDAKLNYDIGAPRRHDGALLPHGAGDMRVICLECAQNLEVKVCDK